MNLFKIAIKDLKEFLIQKKIIFLILFISLIISSYGFMFFTASNMNIAQFMNSYKGVTNNYYIYKENLTQEEIKETINYFKEKNIDITFRLYSKLEKWQEVEELVAHNETKKKQLYNLIIGSNKTEEETVDFVGEMMTQNDRDTNSDYIMIKSDGYFALNDMFILNKEISIRDKTYKVKALDQININFLKYLDYINTESFRIDNISDIEVGIIPDTTFLKDNYEIEGFEIITPINISNEEKVNISNFLESKFSGRVLLPEKEQTSLLDINYYTIFYIVLMVMALVNIMALFTYWINKNSRKYMIYRLCGANNLQLYFLIVIEAMLICITSLIISIVFYYISVPALKLLDIDYILNFFEILTIGIIILLLVYINVHLIIRKILKKEIRYLRWK